MSVLSQYTNKDKLSLLPFCCE